MTLFYLALSGSSYNGDSGSIRVSENYGLLNILNYDDLINLDFSVFIRPELYIF